MAVKYYPLIFVITILALLSACTFLPEEEGFTPPPIIPRVEIPIRTETVGRADIVDYTRASGRAAAVISHNIYLGHDIPSAILIERHFDPDDLRVNAGDILAVFSADDAQAQLAPLERALSLAQINYEAAVRTLGEARADYEQLEIRHTRLRESRSESNFRELTLLQERIINARRRYESERTLFEAGVISQDALETFRRNLSELEEELDNFEAASARNALLQDAQLEQDLREARARAENDAAMRREQLNLRVAQENLRDLHEHSESFILRAPVDGLITYFEDLFIGDTYRSDRRLFTIADDSSMFITMLLTPAERFRFTVGNIVELEATVNVGDERRTIEFYGTIISLSQDQRRDALIDDDTIVIDVADWPEELELGNLVWVYLTRASVYDVVAIPLNALQSINDFHFVRVAEDGVSRERQVEVGIQSSSMVEIISGLSPGEEIVVR